MFQFIILGHIVIYCVIFHTGTHPFSSKLNACYILTDETARDDPESSANQGIHNLDQPDHQEGDHQDEPTDQGRDGPEKPAIQENDGEVFVKNKEALSDGEKYDGNKEGIFLQQTQNDETWGKGPFLDPSDDDEVEDIGLSFPEVLLILIACNSSFGLLFLLCLYCCAGVHQQIMAAFLGGGGAGGVGDVGGPEGAGDGGNAGGAMDAGGAGAAAPAGNLPDEQPVPDAQQPDADLLDPQDAHDQGTSQSGEPSLGTESPLHRPPIGSRVSSSTSTSSGSELCFVREAYV